MPKTFDMSVSASAGMPSAAARFTASSTLTIPSATENSECILKWTNLGRFGGAAMLKILLRKRLLSGAMNPALGALLLGATCIALSPIFVRLSECGPTATAFWRVALAVPVLWILYAAKTKGRGTAYSGKWPLLFAAGFAFACDLGFWHASIQHASVANSTLLANLASIFVTLAAWIFLRQRPTGVFLAGLAAALAGVAMLVHNSVEFSGTGLLGDALGVVTAMFYAAYLLAVKSLRDRGEST